MARKKEVGEDKKLVYFYTWPNLAAKKILCMLLFLRKEHRFFILWNSTWKASLVGNCFKLSEPVPSTFEEPNFKCFNLKKYSTFWTMLWEQLFSNSSFSTWARFFPTLHTKCNIKASSNKALQQTYFVHYMKEHKAKVEETSLRNQKKGIFFTI